MKTIILIIILILNSAFAADEIIIKRIYEFKNTEEYKDYLYEVLKRGQLKPKDLDNIKNELIKVKNINRDNIQSNFPINFNTTASVSNRKIIQVLNSESTVLNTDITSLKIKVGFPVEKTDFFTELSFLQNLTKVSGSSVNYEYSKISQKKNNSIGASFGVARNVYGGLNLSFSIISDKIPTYSGPGEIKLSPRVTFNSGLNMEVIHFGKNSIYIGAGLGFEKVTGHTSLTGGSSFIESGVNIRKLSDVNLRLFSKLEAESLKSNLDAIESRQITFGLSFGF